MMDKMTHWLISDIGIHPSAARKYSKYLYNKGIGSIDNLAKKFQKNSRFLSDEKEIDEDDLELIIEKLINQKILTGSVSALVLGPSDVILLLSLFIIIKLFIIILIIII